MHINNESDKAVFTAKVSGTLTYLTYCRCDDGR